MFGRSGLLLGMLLYSVLQHRLRTHSCHVVSWIFLVVGRPGILLVALLEETAIRRTGHRKRHYGVYYCEKGRYVKAARRASRFGCFPSIYLTLLTLI